MDNNLFLYTQVAIMKRKLRNLYNVSVFRPTNREFIVGFMLKTKILIEFFWEFLKISLSSLAGGQRVFLLFRRARESKSKGNVKDSCKIKTKLELSYFLLYM